MHCIWNIISRNLNRSITHLQIDAWLRWKDWIGIENLMQHFLRQICGILLNWEPSATSFVADIMVYVVYCCIENLMQHFFVADIVVDIVVYVVYYWIENLLQHHCGRSKIQKLLIYGFKCFLTSLAEVAKEKEVSHQMSFTRGKLNCETYKQHSLSCQNDRPS